MKSSHAGGMTMRLIDLDQKIIVPIRDDMAETVYEVQMTVGEFFDKFLEGNKPEIVDAVPVVHGHWIYRRNGWAECSVCRHDFIGVYDVENSARYCRHCGAKMDGEAR